ncbi:MAG: helicase C-terminal domain-containing protein [Candidatus Gracilibacteria bacterium]|nr:helicase C-terminal domain-containing protein [Candidatus Gracilibacteria bacterium]
MIICIDLETTGLDKYNDKIIEIAMVKFDPLNFEVIDTFSSLVDPEISIPDLITNITNISDSDVFGAPKISELKNDIVNFVGSFLILGHNISFDIDFLVNNGVKVDNNIIIDTFFLANILCFTESSLNLEVLCNSFGIGFEGAHRALNDVKATIRLFEKLILKFNKLTTEKKHLLFYIFNKSQDRNIVFLRDLLFQNIDSNLTFGDFEKKILKKIGKIEKDEEFLMDTNIDNNNMSKIFKTLGSVEIRANQLKMTDMVMDTFINKNKVVVEAPTGLGKSFAYLIPSIIHSLKTGEKVFVSTKTKALQDQLYTRDLLYLKDNIGFNFKYTKLKGKKNYISVRLFFDEFWLDDIVYNKIGFLSKILLWFFETKYGELDELNFFGQEYSYLRFLNADSFLVLDDKNDYKKYEYLHKARVRLENSNIIIVNHSLLFSDLNSETGVLGKISNLVIDEGHNIEDSVTDSLKQNYSLKSLGEHFDVIEKILNKINSKKIEFLKYKENLFSKLELLDDYIYSYIDTKVGNSINFKMCLVKSDFFEQNDFDNLLKKIELDFLDIMDKLSIEQDYNFAKEIALLQGNYDIIRIMLDIKTDNKYIKIFSYNDNNGISFEYTLLNPGEYLQKNLWLNVNSCILTSATLKIGGNFDYFKKILFLDNFQFYSFDSDFDYKKQATLFIPTDLGDIKNNSLQIVNFLGRFYSIVRGKVLTLLTSYSSIKEIYTSVNPSLKKEGINLYAQGLVGSKVKLLNHYLSDPANSILLGTDSFWEGIDIPGEDLKYLVIHKFPFIVPTDPIFQARSVFFKDPFLEYSVPKAIIKLKQGFGRLIRTKTDSGLVILLDNRIITTAWGSHFFDAFPNDVNIKKGKSEQFLSILENKF